METRSHFGASSGEEIRSLTQSYSESGQMAEHTRGFFFFLMLLELMVQPNTHNTVCCGADMYLEVIWKEQFAGPEETENVAEYLAVPIYEVVLLQAVQHDGLCAIEQTTDSEN